MVISAILNIIKESIKYSNKYVLQNVLNGNQCSIKYVWKKALNTVIKMY